MTPTKFVDALARVRMESVFNPYSERCPFFDLDDGAKIRKANLLVLLKASNRRGVHSVWIGRDLGYRGGRRTGIPLTDEVHLARVSEAFGVRLFQATAGPPLSERTATLIAQVLRSIPQQVFFWNVFPFHPFEPGQPLSNRCHTREERERCLQFLLQILEMLQPRQVVAIGRDAEIALCKLKLAFNTVRHPSYGGQTEFIEGIEKLYNVSIKNRNFSLLQET
jgi:hypothetical protein